MLCNLQWNLLKLDTFGDQPFVIYREVVGNFLPSVLFSLSFVERLVLFRIGGFTVNWDKDAKSCNGVKIAFTCLFSRLVIWVGM